MKKERKKTKGKNKTFIKAKEEKRKHERRNKQKKVG